MQNLGGKQSVLWGIRKQRMARKNGQSWGVFLGILGGSQPRPQGFSLKNPFF